MNLRLMFMCTAVGLLLAGCVKEGPAGPTGPPGESVADDMHVESFTVLSSEWELVGNGMKATRQVSSLTQDVIDHDAVVLFLGRDGMWYPLPHQVNALSYTYSCQPGEVTITITGTQIQLTLPWKLVYLSDSE